MRRRMHFKNQSIPLAHIFEDAIFILRFFSHFGICLTYMKSEHKKKNCNSLFVCWTHDFEFYMKIFLQHPIKSYHGRRVFKTAMSRCINNYIYVWNKSMQVHWELSYTVIWWCEICNYRLWGFCVKKADYLTLFKYNLNRFEGTL